MAFTNKIQRYIGETTSVSGSVSSALERGVDYVLGVVKSSSPNQLGMFANEFKISSSMLAASVPIFNLRDRYVFDLLKVIRDGYIVQPVSEDQQFAISDSSSIYFSQKASPSYYVDSNSDLIIQPDTSATSTGSIHAVLSSNAKTIHDTNETIKDNTYVLLGNTFLTKELFPDIWKELVVLHASELLLVEKISDFASKLPTDLDADTTLFDAIVDIDLSISTTFPTEEVNDALTKAQNLIDGASMGDDSATAESAQFWLLDEDEDMVGSTLQVAAQELGRANSILGRFNAELSASTLEKSQEEKEFQINLQKKMSLYDKIIGKLNTDYQWQTQQLQLIASKKQEFIQAMSTMGTSDNPQEKAI